MCMISHKNLLSLVSAVISLPLPLNTVADPAIFFAGPDTTFQVDMDPVPDPYLDPTFQS
jgi:hypothetical protein